MPKQTKTCRVCGRVYEACNSIRTGGKTFNWREVACSPECGMKYLERITASRSIVEPIEEPMVAEACSEEVFEECVPELQGTERVELFSTDSDRAETEDVEAAE